MGYGVRGQYNCILYYFIGVFESNGFGLPVSLAGEFRCRVKFDAKMQFSDNSGTVSESGKIDHQTRAPAFFEFPGILAESMQEMRIKHGRNQQI